MRRIKSKRLRIAVIVLSVILGAAVIFTGAAYLYIHNLIHKMNFVTETDQTDNAGEAQDVFLPGQQEDVSQEADSTDTVEDGAKEAAAVEVVEDEPEAEGLPEASVDEIAVIEAKIQDNMEQNQTQIKYDKEVFNVLLIGSDSRKSGGSGRSDAMILISINKRTKTITATSILRDIYLKIPGKENSNRINTAFAYGGAKLLMDTIEQNFKIKIDKYATIDFFAFIDIVDAVGGVTLKVSQADIPVINGYITELNRLTGQPARKDCLTQPGELLLNGKQALGYSRNRYVGNADFERTARQRQVLEQLYGKIKTLKYSEFKELLNIILPQITTNLTEGEIFSMILSLPAYLNYDIKQWSVPISGTYKNLRIRGMAVLGIDFEENIKEIQERIFGE